MGNIPLSIKSCNCCESKEIKHQVNRQFKSKLTTQRSLKAKCQAICKRTQSLITQQ